jgi:hypothetical protein
MSARRTAARAIMLTVKEEDSKKMSSFSTSTSSKPSAVTGDPRRRLAFRR